MATLHLKPAVGLADMLPSPAHPERFGPRDKAERALFSLVMDGIESGPGSEMDDAYFDRLRSRIAERAARDTQKPA